MDEIGVKIKDFFIGYDKEKLSQMVDNLESTSDGLFRDSIEDLRKKLKVAKTDEEKFLVTKQIYKLTQFHYGYLQYKNKNGIHKANQDLTKLIKEVNGYVKSGETYQISDAYNRLNNGEVQNGISGKIVYKPSPEIEKKDKVVQVSQVNTEPNLRMGEIKKILEQNDSKKIIGIIIDELRGLEVKIDGKIIKFTDEFIKENYNRLVNNFILLITFIIDIESDGNASAKNNEGSTAKGLGQWLTGNGRYEKGLNGKKRWLTSSYETSLNSVIGKYGNNDFVRKKLPFLPKGFIVEKTQLSPLKLGLQEQLYLLMLDITSSSKKSASGTKIEDFLGLALLGNSWGVKQIYNIFHHTNPDSKTKLLVQTEFNKYKNNFIQLALNDE